MMKLQPADGSKKKIDYRAMHETESLLRGLGLHTVCVQARCPNISECFHRKTATFLILGEICTRGCGFCGVGRGAPRTVDPGEPGRVAEAVIRMGLRHAVITSVTRDDLPDGGAGIFADCIRALRKRDASLKIEVLVPDFGGDELCVCTVTSAGPDIFGHNIETVPSLYGSARDGDYGRSIRVLSYAKACSRGLRTKSGLLVGLGETASELEAVFRDLRGAGCDYLSIGQYLRPGKVNLPVASRLPTEAFERYKIRALEAGFLHVESGPYVRSSYCADRYE
jgi:lipoic acid synthetase